MGVRYGKHGFDPADGGKRGSGEPVFSGDTGPLRRLVSGSHQSQRVDRSAMNVLLVLAHPRRRSLTGLAAEAFATAAAERGHLIEWADLVTENFDPVLREADEPDWN